MAMGRRAAAPHMLSVRHLTGRATCSPHPDAASAAAAMMPRTALSVPSPAESSTHLASMAPCTPLPGLSDYSTPRTALPSTVLSCRPRVLGAAPDAPARVWADGAVAGGRGRREQDRLWLKANLAPHGGTQGACLARHVMYMARCADARRWCQQACARRPRVTGLI